MKIIRSLEELNDLPDFGELEKTIRRKYPSISRIDIVSLLGFIQDKSPEYHLANMYDTINTIFNPKDKSNFRLSISNHFCHASLGLNPLWFVDVFNANFFKKNLNADMALSWLCQEEDNPWWPALQDGMICFWPEGSLPHCLIALDTTKFQYKQTVSNFLIACRGTSEFNGRFSARKSGTSMKEYFFQVAKAIGLNHSWPSYEFLSAKEPENHCYFAKGRSNEKPDMTAKLTNKCNHIWSK